MQITKIEPDIEKKLQHILGNYPHLNEIIKEIYASSGRALVVGGAVRDLFLGLPIKDVDIEVYGIHSSELELILRGFGVVSLVGKAFGVFRLHGLDIDWSLPRRDSAGRKPEVVVDPNMSFLDAFGRRDLTINAMGIDLTTFELIDPYQGLRDLREGLLRAPKIDLFVEDPLRFFRVMQFIGRFQMMPDAPLNRTCATMSLQGISVERIEDEFEKLFLRSQRPSCGLRWLRELGRLHEVLPEVAATIGIIQDPRWHPEGDVFEHTMQAVDAAAVLTYDTQEQKLIIVVAALCHDLGKVTTTSITPAGITSYGHDEAGAVICVSLLKRITRKNSILEAVPKLVRCHMQPSQFIVGNAKPAAYKRLARKLAPQTTISMLALLAIADNRGRNAQSQAPLVRAVLQIEEFLAHAKQIEVHERAEEPVLHGRDLLGIVKPGPRMGALLKKAYEIQIEEGIKDKQELKRRLKI
jgi:tRNA nucleotidyltransferase (CCA-adding enzyme)